MGLVLPRDVKARSWQVGALVAITLLLVAVILFVVLGAMGLPTLETSLTFIPVLGFSMLAGIVSGIIVRARARRTSRTRES